MRNSQPTADMVSHACRT